MDINTACNIASIYSGERYFSHIIKSGDIWCFSLCDKEGHDLFVSPIVVNEKTGEFSKLAPDYTECTEYIEEVVPVEYCSTKRNVIISVKEYKGYDADCVGLMEILYEKYNLYSVSQAEAFEILGYYMDTLKDYDKKSVCSKAYLTIINDKRSLKEIIDESKRGVKVESKM